MDIGYIWTEIHFKENDFIIYKVKSLNYPDYIAFIKIGPHDYEVFKTRDDLRLQEILLLYRLATVLQEDYPSSWSP